MIPKYKHHTSFGDTLYTLTFGIRAASLIPINYYTAVNSNDVTNARQGPHDSRMGRG